MQAPYKKTNRLTKTKVDKLPEDHPDKILFRGKEEREKRDKEKKSKKSQESSTQ